MNTNRSLLEIVYNTHNDCVMCVKGICCDICLNKNKVNHRNYE